MKYSDARVLSIDGDERARDWIRATLFGSGVDCDVTSASRGREAFSLLNQRDFDLCIIEYALPDMTGVQLCSLIRQVRNNIPVLFFTAMDRSIDREKAMAAGATDYLCKPQDLEVFADAVAHQLSKRQRRVIGQNVSYMNLARAA